MMKVMKGTLRSTARPGYLSIAVATATPDALTTSDPCVSGGAYLVDENGFPEVLDELDDCSRILRFIEDPGHLPLPQ